MKIGRYEINIDENDEILDNGSIYQLVTRNCRNGYPLVVSKKCFKELMKNEMIYTNEELQKISDARYIIPCKLYKFNTDKIK